MVAKVRTTAEGGLENPLPLSDESPEDVERREEELERRRRDLQEEEEKLAEGIEAGEVGGQEETG